MERLQKVIANSGFCSRRKAEEYIEQGKVVVNGKRVEEHGMKVNYDDEIIVDGQLLNAKEEKEYYLLYKPQGVISSVSDEKGRKTVVDLIPTKARIYPVGRLDFNTTGLLLLTNDGELTGILTHPSHKVEKVYRAKVEGIVTPKEFMELKNGIEIERRKVIPTYVKIIKKNETSNTTSLYIGIQEGRNHIVKKMLLELGHEVLKLKRESLAFLTLEGLKPGEYRTLTIKEIKKLYSLK
ncbi:MAG: rRNA pseudouridine synthase [Bacilli bacterium]|nr:rRNA pseudouridine synthase [Bacilli bacterium]MBR1818343.1 rRNA pseudouridine synthase [Bacilli bacterium]